LEGRVNEVRADVDTRFQKVDTKFTTLQPRLNAGPGVLLGTINR
jgi:hypothetical protein